MKAEPLTRTKPMKFWHLPRNSNTSQYRRIDLYTLSRLPMALLMAAVTLSGCASMEPHPDPVEAVPATAAADPVSSQQPGITPGSSVAPTAAADPVEPEGVAEPARSGPTLYRGTGEMVNMPKVGKPVRFYGEAVSLNFEQAPLIEVVHAVMGDILELDYILEHPIGGEVTLRTRTPVPRDQLLDILESLLKANNALMIRDGEGRYYVSGSSQMTKLIPSVASSTAGVSGYSTLIIPLQHIGARSMADILAPLAEESAFVRVDAVRNMLMLAGTRAQLQGWQEIIETFDVDMLKGMSVGIFPIQNASMADIDTALSDLLGKSGGTGEEMADGLAGIGSMVRIIPVERLSSIMVVTPKPQYLDRLGTWIERLDREPDANFERRLYVYPVQNSNAVHLAELLSTIYGGAGSSSGSRSGVAPGLTPEKVSEGGSSSKKKNNKSNAKRTSNYDLEGTRIVADEDNNALLIYATGKEYRKIKPALAQLDIAATQVIIEASIIEVTLTDDIEYGLSWTFSGGLDGGYEGIGTLGTLSRLSGAGFSYQVLNAAGEIKGVLNALATEDLLNVISSPSVMVLDNQTASIRVGDQVPIETGSTFSEEGGTERVSVSYRDTGVLLEVTPSVNAGGMVTMDINQTVTDVGPVDSEGTGGRTFLEREIISQVAVRTDESVVLGGLIRENKSSGSSGIPLLHDLPLIGPLFGKKTMEDNRTELLVIITPRVIYSESELRDVSREMRTQMRGLDLLDVSKTSSFLAKDLKAPKEDQEIEK